jgi:hypothetical protein
MGETGGARSNDSGERPSPAQEGTGGELLRPALERMAGALDRIAEALEPAGTPHLLLELNFGIDLPPETQHAPVRHELQDLAARLGARFVAFCWPEVRLVAPGHLGEDVDHPRLEATLRVIHYDLVGHARAAEEAEELLSRIRAFMDEQRMPHLGRLEVGWSNALIVRRLERWDRSPDGRWSRVTGP